jgi:hypothetical protein
MLYVLVCGFARKDYKNIVMIILFSIISSFLTLLALVAFLFTVRKHYNQIFAESFINFVMQINTGHYSQMAHDQCIIFISTLNSSNADKYSVEKYLADTHQCHHHGSQYYADIYKELQNHKLRVLLKALL